VNRRPVYKVAKLQESTMYLRGSDNLIPECTNTAYSCGKHGPVTAWFMSAWPGNVIPVPKIYDSFF
jgi:hypothetical protein